MFVGPHTLSNASCLDWETADDFHPQDTDTAKDYEENQFLDLRKPLLRQVWEAKFRYILVDYTAPTTYTGSSKAYYLQQVHQPRHLPRSARLFGPEILEVCVYNFVYVALLT